MAGMILFTIPLEVQSLNRTGRMHWRSRYRHDQTWKAAVAAYVPPHRRPVLPFARAHVHISATRKVLIRDQDNLVGGCKALIDALRHAGLIAADDREHLTVEYHQQLALGERPSTSVTITDTTQPGPSAQGMTQ